MQIANLLRSHARLRGGAGALRVLDDERSAVSWAELTAMVEAVVRQVPHRIPPGAPVLLAVDNTAESLAVLLGLACAGTDLVLCEAGSSLLADPASVLHRVGAGVAIDRSGVVGHRSLAPEDLLAPVVGRGLPDRQEQRAGETRPASAVWQLTSGSTGEPRLARQTTQNLLYGGEIYCGRYQVTDRDTVLATVPMAHSFGVVAGLFTALVSGATLVTARAFSARRTRTAIEDGATLLLGTPLVFEILLAVGRPRQSLLRAALSSGGPLDAALLPSLQEKLGCPVYQVYGSTETGLIASQFPRPEAWLGDHVGVPGPGVELRWAPPGPEDAADGRHLLVRTRTMLTGYWPESARGAVGADGWYRTGDVAHEAADGQIKLLRRKTSFIDVGGRKVNPDRVERFLNTHAGVGETAVYGVESVGGEEVHAAVTLVGNGPAGRRRPDADPVPELVAFCRDHLAPYEVPLRIHVLDRLPRNGMGKVDRSRLPRT